MQYEFERLLARQIAYRDRSIDSCVLYLVKRIPKSKRGFTKLHRRILEGFCWFFGSVESKQFVERDELL
jgi:hypothetical protein